MSSPTLPPVSCPECGRKLHIPAGTGTVNLACKGCLHLFSYNYATGQMAPRGLLQPANASKKRKLKLALLVGTALILGIALGSLLYFNSTPTPSPIILEPKTEHTLEDIQKQLKSLTE